MIVDGSRDTEHGADIIARFESVFRTEIDRVHSYARARLGSSEADDVVADVFHAVALAVRDGNEAALAPAWIMTVTKNKVIDRWRAAQRRKVRDMRWFQRERHRLVELDRWTDPGNREQVVATLDRLSDRHRILLVLHYVDGLSVPEIADDLGASASSIESALARARRAFRSEYRSEVHR